MREMLDALVNIWTVLAAPLWAVFLPSLVWGRRRYEGAELRRLVLGSLFFSLLLALPVSWGLFYAVGMTSPPGNPALHPATYASEMAVLGFPFVALFATGFVFLIHDRRKHGPETAIPWRSSPIRVVCNLVIAAALVAAVLAEVFLMAASAGAFQGWG